MKFTEQQAFDLAVSTVVAQGGPAFDANKFGCMYRAPDGNKCHFGALIPDELYSSRMETKNALAVLEDFPEVTSHLGGLSAHFLSALQSVHDSAVDVGDFWTAYRMRVDRFADCRKLNAIEALKLIDAKMAEGK